MILFGISPVSFLVWLFSVILLCLQTAWRSGWERKVAAHISCHLHTPLSHSAEAQFFGWRSGFSSALLYLRLTSTFESPFFPQIPLSFCLVLYPGADRKFLFLPFTSYLWLRDHSERGSILGACNFFPSFDQA